MKRIYIEYDESKDGELHLEVRDCTVKEISSGHLTLWSLLVAEALRIEVWHLRALW